MKANLINNCKMQIMKLCTLVFFVFLLSCSTNLNKSSSWTEDEILVRHMSQTHHWGQSGDSTPNNGWSDYTSIILYNTKKEKKVYKQSMGEFSVSIDSISKNDDKFWAVSIPNAGIFYSPKENANCMPDNIEMLGLELEFLLHIISQAFPEGPNYIIQPLERTVSIGPIEVRFMQGIMKIKSKVSVNVSLNITKSRQYLIEMMVQDNGKPMTLDWKAKGDERVVPDNESLESWESCWRGRQSINDNKTEFDIFFPNHKNIKNFGEIRATLHRKKK